MEFLFRAIVTDLVQTVAVFAVTALAYVGLNRVTTPVPKYIRQIVVGGLFGAAALLCMAMTIGTREDAFISAAPAAAALAGPFGGALSAVIVAVMTALSLIWQGGR